MEGLIMHPAGRFVIATCLLAATFSAAAAEPRAQVRDVARLADPGKVELDEYMHERLVANEKGRLLAMSEDALLDGFRNRPGKQAWIGEHVGKWLHAATLAWAYTRDSALRKKIDLVVKELLKTQEADGYLGTYVPAQRFGLHPGADWDVWVHKYCLIGLLACHQYLGDAAALDGARRAADLLLKTFGPGRKDIIEAGTHVGMAATSILEPMVQLYNVTGDSRYLEFAKYLVDAYEHPRGPRIVTSLLEHGDVHRTANGKAYEMMSNLVGLCELYRATGEKQYLQVCEKAWVDIVEKRMYITGGVSLGEHFQEDGMLPNAGAVAETCANVTWEQLNIQLLRLTGEAKYADVLERLVFNHVLGAQKADGSAFCYFTPLEGKKAYDTGINCCASSGPRGVALIPTFAFTAREDSLDVNLFLRGRASFLFSGDNEVSIEQQTLFPGVPKVFIRAMGDIGGKPVKYRVRVPSWAKPDGTFADASWKEYTDDARFELDFTPRVVKGTGSNEGRVAILRGPLVYCLESRFNTKLPRVVALAGDTAESLGIEAIGAKTQGEASYRGQALLRVKGTAWKRSSKGLAAEPVELLLSDFASAGADGSAYRVWLPLAGRHDPSKMSLLAFAKESWSRAGNVEASISDENSSSYRVTFDGKKADEDWFAVEVEEPVEMSRVVFVHGKNFHDGGWFDASAGKPKLQVKRSRDGVWENLATLDSYPGTTATDSKGLEPGQRFEAKLAAPVRAVGLRIVGKPACGDNPTQAFSSCAELAAYGSQN